MSRAEVGASTGAEAPGAATVAEAVPAYDVEFAEAPLYLNHASYGPPSRAVERTVHELVAAAVRGAPAGALHAEDDRARAVIARLTGAAPERVALTTSTSQGLLQTAFGLRGEVLVSLDEFPANVYSWRRAEEAGRLRLRALPASGAGPAPVTPERVADALTPAVTALAVSAVDFRTGYRADLAALREVIGPDRLLVVDGIQGFGAIDIDWSPADVLAVGGQKWLRSGWGTGFLAFSERGLEAVAPSLGSWAGVLDPVDYDGRPHPARTDAGRHAVTSLSPFATGALATGLELLERAGPALVAARVADAAEKVIRAIDAAGLPVLSPREPERRAGIVVAGFTGGSAPGVHARLSSAGVTATLHGSDRIRFSPHATTTTAAVDRLAELLIGV
ncbi:aminotransferase class V-fold PLP-dependent enzyme [Herbiconiux ginsengi]|uniref:Selenocysteine lyase/Cysteine desulfurase n=1 Tax=Herbiconiux ginsengi TaxID=381665 RepID=A0A1H3KN26_9MICO|nr:aminotransferase class V-fold PLP-dependent enzyme [Herbiconiux ginsengi]SDY53551.1 Selenocysteine lyase/Cysteine desulfurase [Herbiconiux ginsengi]